MMALSTKERYAARIMVYLAIRQGTGPVTKYQIAEAEALSADYIEQIMVRLKAAGLVLSHRGRKGGFTIARDPRVITLYNILTAVEGPIRPVPCIDTQCKREATCPTRPVWLKAATLLEDLFSRTTVAQMAEETKAQESISYSI
ncbi:MAG: Rrf2 family transcriptional regulator [Verrucomicrobia bacterium]|jgi:Rrf2 family transcriptional regulator, cysteine metabolism repressor|nr:Rrf2 family transcriptional regulator [Verrucomicrobiota bacterium]MBT7067623.1 Rrf2 family transcriptional regulator [Verrucomicrobiota bacterium]MBT7701578.1 Rrf2 family transcriptional regulator [Verrucomicrobiota bacterium]